jgi:hypothetical protein
MKSIYNTNKHSILKRGLESFGIGTIPMNLKQKAFGSLAKRWFTLKVKQRTLLI